MAAVHSFWPAPNSIFGESPKCTFPLRNQPQCGHQEPKPRLNLLHVRTTTRHSTACVEQESSPTHPHSGEPPCSHARTCAWSTHGSKVQRCGGCIIQGSLLCGIARPAVQCSCEGRTTDTAAHSHSQGPDLHYRNTGGAQSTVPEPRPARPKLARPHPARVAPQFSTPASVPARSTSMPSLASSVDRACISVFRLSTLPLAFGFMMY